MNPKQFLTIGGVVLVLVGILGYVGVIGPTADRSIFGPMWWFDNPENIAHTVLGIIAIAAAYVIPANLQKWLVVAVGVLAVIVGLYSLVGETTLVGANLENPADTALHLLIGAWALYAGLRKSDMAMGSTM
jgi:hypothetical protein